MEKLCFGRYKHVQKTKKGINLNYQVSTTDIKQLHHTVIVFSTSNFRVSSCKLVSSESIDNIWLITLKSEIRLLQINCSRYSLRCFEHGNIKFQSIYIVLFLSEQIQISYIQQVFLVGNHFVFPTEQVGKFVAEIL